MKPNNPSPAPPLNSFFDIHPRVCAVILAGTKGSRLFPMTSSSDMPKHLLPVAGVPSILRLIQGLVNFPEIVIAIYNQDTQTLNVVQQVATLKEESSTDDMWSLQGKANNQKITILKLPEDCFGSVDALRQVEDKNIVHPKTRMVVVPGDLVVLKNNINLDALIRPDDESACTALLVDVGEMDEHGVPLKESAKVRI
jgi:NDP-sugar pyrophosphorylase family protein